MASSATGDERASGRGCGPDPDAEWWGVGDVAVRLGRTPGAVRRAVERGELPAPEVRAPRRRWLPATILDWEEQRRIACLRWPLQPFLDAGGCSVMGLARAVGVSHGLVAHFARHGVPDRIADDWAIRLGYHPIEVWGWDWIAAGLPAVDLSYHGETGR